MFHLQLTPNTRITKLTQIVSNSGFHYYEAYLNDRNASVNLDHLVDIALLNSLGAELIAPQLCEVCKKHQPHVYLSFHDNVFCLKCNEALEKPKTNIICVDFKRKKRLY